MLRARTRTGDCLAWHCDTQKSTWKLIITNPVVTSIFTFLVQFQNIKNKEEAEIIFLDSDFFKGSRIFGFFQLYKERFLHFNSNLYLSELDPLLSQEERLITGKNVFNEEKEFDLFEEKNQKVLYEVKHSKKLRSGELHYMDHPKFGMLLKL